MTERRYGQWAGRPDGMPEDQSRCIQGVYSSFRRMIESQCSRKRGHGPQGLYCTQHAKRYAK